MQQNSLLYAFNRGVISPLALTRIDLKRQAMSAEIQTNYMPRELGAMSLRCGLGYIDDDFNDLFAFHVPFIFATTDTAIVEFTAANMRVRVNESIVTRVAVATTVTNGNFASLTGWNDEDESGAASTLVSGQLSLVGTNYKQAIRTQQVTVASGDDGKEHALHVVVVRGNITFKVGTADGTDEYVATTTLGEGTHSLSFTPTGNFWIYIANITPWAALVSQCAVETSGAMVLPTPYGSGDLENIRYDQSGDIIFIACNGYQQMKVERRSTTGWSFVKYYADDGPYLLDNITTTTLTPSAVEGDITVTASRAIFYPTHVGAIFRLDSTGQLVTQAFTGDNQFTDNIRVTGVTTSRTFNLTLAGTWVATVTLQRSLDGLTGWDDVTNYTTNQAAIAITDGLDNQIWFYRLGIKPGNYTSGTVTATLKYASGSLSGVVRVTGYTSPTVVNAAVIADLGATTATTSWAEGQWSNFRGYPTSVAFYEGRLWWVGRDLIAGSVSDAFASFDDTVTGDSGPILRSIGSGPVDVVNWVLPLQRLLLGGQGAEHSIRSSSLDEPLTPTDFNIKDPSTRGSAAMAALKIDTNGIFVQNGATRVIEMSYQGAYAIVDYSSADLTQFCPEVITGPPSPTPRTIVKIVVQRKIDTRVHCILSDGTVAVMVYDPIEKVNCFINVTTNGVIEDAVVLPGGTGSIEDKVYYSVKRTINGVTRRFFERWALEGECVGATLNKQADAFITFTNGSPTATVTVAHLLGETVVVWADGKCMADVNGEIQTFVVDPVAGTISLTNGGVPYLATTGIVGLGYTAQFQGAKMALQAQDGTTIGMKKNLDHVGLVLANTHPKGVQYGDSFSRLFDMPNIEGGPVDQDAVWVSYDNDALPLDGQWLTDKRLCLQSQAPRPATITAAILGVDVHERT